MGIKVPVQVNTDALRVALGRAVLPPHAILWVLQPRQLQVQTCDVMARVVALWQRPTLPLHVMYVHVYCILHALYIRSYSV